MRLFVFFFAALAGLFGVSLSQAIPLPPSEAVNLDDATLDLLAHETQWIKLLHYEKKLFGGYESQADGDKFFLSPEGKTNPTAELKADLEAFRTGIPLVPESTPAACRFPARRKWLEQQLRLPFAPIVCPKYWQYREATAAKSATLVFSAYYLNNPASAFGHSFLRLNKAETAYPGKRFELLDNGVNYAAVLDTENPILYALKGTFGFFHGVFTRVPYYYKVREYNDFESRDLWEYDLNMNGEEIERLVDHIWELGSTYFDYFYLSENCAYHILTLIEAAKPDADLTSHLRYVVIPADTIKALDRIPDFVARVKYRPSMRVQFAQRLEGLSGKEYGMLRRVAENRNLDTLSDAANPTEKVHVLDAAIDQIDLSEFKTLLAEPKGEIGQWKQKLLIARSQIPVSTPQMKIEMPADELPHTGHDITRVGLETGVLGKGESFTDFQFRFALHDLLDPSAGYPQGAQIEFLNVQTRSLPAQKTTLRLEDATAFRVVSLTPFTFLEPKLSWRFRLGGTRIYDDTCLNCFAGIFEVGGGLAKEVVKDTVAYALVETDIAMSKGFQSGLGPLRLGFGPTLGARISFSKNLKAGIFGAYKYQPLIYPRDRMQFGGEVRWGVGDNFAVNFKTSVYPRQVENGLGLYYYF